MALGATGRVEHLLALERLRVVQIAPRADAEKTDVAGQIVEFGRCHFGSSGNGFTVKHQIDSGRHAHIGVERLGDLVADPGLPRLSGETAEPRLAGLRIGHHLDAAGNAVLVGIVRIREAHDGAFRHRFQ